MSPLICMENVEDIKQSTLNICRFEFTFSLFIAWLIQAVSGRNSVGAWHVKEVISREKDNRALTYEWKTKPRNDEYYAIYLEKPFDTCVFSFCENL